MLVSDFALIFGVAAITIVLTSKFKLPSVLGYLLAGAIVGPYVPIPLFANSEKVEQFSELGVIFVMFTIGLEFRLKRFFQILPSSGLRGLIQISCLFVGGVFLGGYFDWSINQSFLLGASLAISSSMIVTKIFDDTKVSDNAKELVYGTLIIQDLFAIIIIAIITSLSLGKSLEIRDIAGTLSRLGLFMAVLTVVGSFLVPRLIHFVLSFRSRELTTVVACGVCFSLAVLSEHLGYSVALGAFLAGILVAESGRSKEIEFNISQLKSIFLAMFFISIGMTIDPVLSYQNLGTALLVSITVIVLQMGSNLFAGILSGYGIQTSLISGISLGQIGEFSFIIASLGKKFNFVTPEFYSVIVTTAVITSVSTPFILRSHRSIQVGLERILPKRIQALILVYLSWYNNEQTKIQSIRFPIRKNMQHMIVTVCCMILISTVMSLLSPLLVEVLERFDFSRLEATELYLLIELFCISPFVIYLFYCAYNLTQSLSQNLWNIKKKQNYIYNIIVHVIRLSALFTSVCIVLLMVFPFIAVSKYALSALVVSAILSLILLWKKTDKLQGQMEDALDRFITSFGPTENSSPMDIPRNIIPGLEDLKLIRLKSNFEAVGKKLSALDLRVQTGATVFAIIRDQQSISLPDGSEVLHKDDLVALVGGENSIEEATNILTRE